MYKRQPRDVENYLSLLTAIEPYYESIMNFENQRAEAGLGMSDEVIDRVIESCGAYLLDAEHSFLAETFDERLENIPDLTGEEKAAYSEKNRQAKMCIRDRSLTVSTMIRTAKRS